MLGDKLRELRVSSTELLKDGLQHLGLLLDYLSELLELGIVTQPVQVAEGLSTSSGTCAGGGSGSSSCLRTSTRCSSATSTSLLSSEVEKVNTAVTFALDRLGSCSASGGRLSRGCFVLGFRLAGALGDTLYDIVKQRVVGTFRGDLH